MGRGEGVEVFVLREGAEVEAELDGGHLRCPDCGEPLSRWGWGRPRQLRLLEGERYLRPRRTWCSRCEASHIIFPAWVVPRRRDGGEVILVALMAKAAGQGHRRIAERLDRPPATVRGWLRRAQGLAEVIRTRATIWAHAFDPGLTPIVSAGSSLPDAVEALGVAVSAAVRRLGPRDPLQVAVGLTGGLLVPGG